VVAQQEPGDVIDWVRLGSFLVGLLAALLIAASSRVPASRTFIVQVLANCFWSR